MPDIPVKKKVFGGCKIKDKRLKKGDVVNWIGDGASACVSFDEGEWPFQELWQTHNPISVADGATVTLRVREDLVGTEIECVFDYACGTCLHVLDPNTGTVLGGGAKIIIN